MTIDDILEINKSYSYIESLINFKKSDDFIEIIDINYVILICGFGDKKPFFEVLHDEDWDELLKDRWDGDGYYHVEILYKNQKDSDGYQTWYYYEIEEIRIFKYREDELSYLNEIPFDWDDFT